MSLINGLSTQGEVLVFGGLLRDIALYGVRNFNSDIDLVVDCPLAVLSSFFNSSRYIVEQNKFGGYRLAVGGWTVDVWTIRETWAFKSGHVEYVGRDSLLFTTITNWDSIIFSFKDGKLISFPRYLESLRLGEIEVILTENPSELGVLMRVIKSICDKRAKVLMPRALKYLKVELGRWNSSQLVSAQKQSLDRVYLSEKELEAFRLDIFSLREDLFGSPLSIKGGNFNLKF
ncbi:hypothetical protein [Pseudomonas chlororaphis]|uniref:hypothetical protein n=1 Tax=Pseudomonas chlororaphis TaxID=587753 RepID=UPI000F567D9B|nr:hypothetical protein [Pseudomonas chlororaphis]AZE06701.1 hypothetical protein C4K11_4561 [Pseudomonas chlororaphis subsp. aureofaciens]MBP5063404.1 hypothetical protein [Pseudomonas chlororaphis]QTT96024.1 hypothetical protein HUT27_21890 [Pseudomonas chlororaphis]